MTLTPEDVDILERYWVQKSYKNFMAFRIYMRANNFKHGWFLQDVARKLTQFYRDWLAGLNPILIIEAPPQHGKSWSITDFIAWVLGRNPETRIIFASFSDHLGVRTNRAVKRHIESDKFKKIFRHNTDDDQPRINRSIIETPQGGYFRNTTIGGSVTGESADIGVIDDPLKGREQANSVTYRNKVWDWFTDDFDTRFSEQSGLILIMTRWHIADLSGLLQEKHGDAITLAKYPALAVQDDEFRKVGDPLFPELKSKEFLLKKKAGRSDASWQSLYQGSPIVVGGEMFKDEHWKWWKTGRLPPISYKFIVADTAQKIKTINDFTCFQCWGMGNDGNIYLLDMFHAKLESPELRKEAYLFYKKHDTPRVKVGDPLLRAFHIEDKSSGSGLIQELKRKKVKVQDIQRNVDKVFRADDAIPEIESGRVYLNEDVPFVGILTEEARHFPNGVHDDAIDTCVSAIEVALINKSVGSSLLAAMEA